MYEAVVVKLGVFLNVFFQCNFRLPIISTCTMQHLSVVVRRSVVVSSRANPVSAHHSPLLPSN